MRIYPVCLPFKTRQSKFGVHSGWSSPPPFHLISKYAPGFTKAYREFFKQIHHRMDIFDRCEDSNTLAYTGSPVEFKTNTYYPPGKLFSFTLLNYYILFSKGTVCARNSFTQSCFYSGESGSPLMIR